MSSAFRASQPFFAIAGSYAKGTMVKDSYDLDLVCYFDSGDVAPGASLEAIYNNVLAVLETRYQVSPKRSAIRLMGPKDGPTHDFHIDVVPGRFTTADRKDVFLHQTEGDKQRLKTNLKRHIWFIQQSRRSAVIQLLKIWKCKTQLDIKTFVLELAVIEAMRGHTSQGLDADLRLVLTTFRDNLDAIQIEDPANPGGNDLSAIFGDTQRLQLTWAAQFALDLEAQNGWEAVLGGLDEASDQVTERALVETAELLPLGEASHRSPLPWRENISGWVSLRCLGETAHQRQFTVTSGGAPVVSGCSLTFVADTGVREPYEVYWQVVNTGPHAASANNLRGEISPSPNPGRPLERSEKTLYSGSHWVECFIVKDGVLVARSGPFVVGIYNPKRLPLPRRARGRR